MTIKRNLILTKPVEHCLLKDIGRAELGSKDYSLRSRYKGKTATLLAVYQQPGANALQVAAAVKQTMDRIAKRFPVGLRYDIPFDTTRFVEALAGDGIDGIYLVAQHARDGALSEQTYKEFALPADRACLEAAAALPLNVMHLHGESVHADLTLALDGGASPAAGPASALATECHTV